VTQPDTAATRTPLPFLRPTVRWALRVTQGWALTMQVLSVPYSRLQRLLTTQGLMVGDINPPWAPKVGLTPMDQRRARIVSWRDHASTPAQKLGRTVAGRAMRGGLVAARTLGSATAAAGFLATYTVVLYASAPFVVAASPAVAVEVGHQLVRAKRWFLTGSAARPGTEAGGEGPGDPPGAGRQDRVVASLDLSGVAAAGRARTGEPELAGAGGRQAPAPGVSR
jgi:hypothetical protein